MSDAEPQNETAEIRQYRFTPPPGATQLILVRHGESAPHVPGTRFELVDGHGDPALSELGRWQAERVGDRLVHEDIAAIYVTTLQRTHQTAAPLATRLGIEPIVEPELREVFLGDWEGGLYRERIAARDPIAETMFREERWDAIPGAESNDALRDRAVGAIERICAAHPDQQVVAVVHGGIIGALLAHAASSRPFAFTGADNGSIHHLVITEQRWIIRRYNDTGHLDSMSAVPSPLT
ncbi:histidine phosphatase family protein [Actinomarinicola tropica]|uniref:histidine phosphatase family protein n=1 Tax=Actinomarinicola tropica TaxID=2789776 RepID=UPI001E2A75AA|nr:histidine phosphatase family protein [Actinomarinicola tropica]